MPQFIRRRRWLLSRYPPEIRHLSLTEQGRLFEPILQEVLREHRRADILAGLAIVAVVILSKEFVAPILLNAGVPWVLLVPSFPMLVAGGLCLVYWRNQSAILKKLRAQMLAEGIRPAVCFECRYFTEGFDGGECPNCGAMLTGPRPASRPADTGTA